MKALRKSLNASKDPHHHQISTPLPPLSKPPAAVVPPQKVIRAVGVYLSNAPQELSFQKGDFFYVVREVNEHGAWYEAHNPMTGARGLVPKAMFEEFTKGAAANGRMSQAISTGPIRSPSLRSPASKTQVFYAVVMHDFVAERTDELDAKAGDPISVVAQSNREWFVAKPIGRLGKPGLIPVSFVQIRDPVSNQPITDIGPLMDSGSLPRVEDWKKQMLNYKANSIALGILEDSSRGPVANSPFMPSSVPPLPTAAPEPEPEPTPAPSAVEPSPHSYQGEQQANSSDIPKEPKHLPEGLLLSAEVVSFHFEMEEYWFRIDALYQPYQPEGTNELPEAEKLILFRCYNDFFDYQTTLLDTFPREAGREPPNPRILPYMPGPASDVNDRLSATRREELHDYLQHLAGLNKTTARYVLENELTRDFLALRPGDTSTEVEAAYAEMEKVGWYDPILEPQPVGLAEKTVEQRINEGVEFVKINPMGGPNSDSEGSDYGDDPEPIPQRQKPTLRPPNGHLHSASVSRGPSSDPRSRGHAPHPSYPSPSYDAEALRDSAYTRSSTSSSSRWPDNSHSSHNTQATSPISQSRSSVADSSQSRSHSLASPNTPSISANNPQTAFIKIKIFDRVQDDLIAIRVHPRVTHGQLMEKVRQRLGPKIVRLSYRNSVHGGDFVSLERDHDVHSWLASTDKHVLYAD